MDYSNPRPPRLPHLHFGRKSCPNNAAYASSPGQRRQHSFRADPPRETQYHLQRPVSAHRASKTTLPRGSRRCHVEHACAPTGHAVTTISSRLPYEPGSASSSTTVVDLPVSGQLAWLGIPVPAEIHLSFRGELSSSTLSSSTTLHDDEKDEDKDDEDLLPEPIEDFQARFATYDRLRVLQARHPLPAIRGQRLWNSLRYGHITLYKRLLVLVLLANIVVMAACTAHRLTGPESFSYRQAATATGANLVATVLMRQEHVINLVFHMACALPHCTPLKVRRFIAKLTYNNGGVHVGSAVSALLWFVLYTVLLTRGFHGTQLATKALTAVNVAVLVLFVSLITLSHPSFRRRYHDQWELSHRFGGWTAVALVWAQMLVVAFADGHAAHQPLGQALVHLPNFWFLIIITCCLIYPWLRLKHLPVVATQLSTHATQLRFTDRRLPTCRGVRLAHNPLLQCHGFATIPNARTSGEDLEKGYSVVISNAGDFTRDMILHPPERIWRRGAPTTGVMRLTSLFKPVVIVATGSGIGPCLSFTNTNRGHPMRIIWSARSPASTYGYGIMNDVLKADNDALIIDTKQTGHPDLVALSHALVREISAEAVMIISNPGVTEQVVFGMEARGVGAFGAIFDS